MKKRNKLTKMRKAQYLFTFVFAALLITVIAYVLIKYAPEAFVLLKSGDEQAMEEYIGGAGLRGVAVLVILQVLQTITIVFPGIPIYMCSGIVFGKLKGTIVCYLTYIFINMAVYLFSRKMKETADELLNNQKNSAIADLMKKTGHPAYMVAMLCVVPIIPNGIIPHLAANSGMSVSSFFKAVAVGCIPGIFLFVCCGDLLMSDYFWLVIAVMIIAFICMIVGLIFKDKLSVRGEALLNRLFGKN